MITNEIKKIIIELVPYLSSSTIAAHMGAYPSYISKYIGKFGKRKMPKVNIYDYKDKLDELACLYAAVKRKDYCIREDKKLVKLSQKESLVNSQRHIVDHLHNPFCKLSFMM